MYKIPFVYSIIIRYSVMTSILSVNVLKNTKYNSILYYNTYFFIRVKYLLKIYNENNYIRRNINKKLQKYYYSS